MQRSWTVPTNALHIFLAALRGGVPGTLHLAYLSSRIYISYFFGDRYVLLRLPPMSTANINASCLTKQHNTARVSFDQASGTLDKKIILIRR